MNNWYIYIYIYGSVFIDMNKYNMFINSFFITLLLGLGVTRRLIGSGQSNLSSRWNRGLSAVLVNKNPQLPANLIHQDLLIHQHELRIMANELPHLSLFTICKGVRGNYSTRVPLGGTENQSNRTINSRLRNHK